MKDEVLKVKVYRVERFNDGNVEKADIEAHFCIINAFGTRLAVEFYEVRGGEHCLAQSIIDVVRIREVHIESEP